eukprot:822062-Prymnesium_polylepis.2
MIQTLCGGRVRPLATARWSDACRGSPRLSAQPPGDTCGGRRSAAGQLGVAVMSTSAQHLTNPSRTCAN